MSSLMELLNWAGEHPILAVLFLFMLVGIAHGLGPKPTVSTRISRED